MLLDTMAKVLCVDPGDIEITLELDLDTDRIIPGFQIPMEKVKGPEPSEVREVIATVYHDYKPEMADRLRGLRDQWDNYVYEEESGIVIA